MVVMRPDEATQQFPCCSKKMRVVLADGVDDKPMDRATVWGQPMA
jgi:hypothetical protein